MAAKELFVSPNIKTASGLIFSKKESIFSRIRDIVFIGESQAASRKISGSLNSRSLKKTLFKL